MAHAKASSLLFDELLFERIFLKPEPVLPWKGAPRGRLVSIGRDEYEERSARAEPVIESDTSGYFEDDPGEAQAPFNGLLAKLAELGADWFREVWPPRNFFAMGAHRLDDDEPLDLRGGRMLAAASALVDLAPEAPGDLRAQALLMDYYSASAVFGASSGAGQTFEPGSGRLALAIAVPDVARVPWEAIAAFRQHPASDEARSRFRAWEHAAAQQEALDAQNFQLKVAQAITRDLTAAVRECEPSVFRALAEEGGKTAIGLIPIVGQVLGLVADVTRIIHDARKRRSDWAWASGSARLAKGWRPRRPNCSPAASTARRRNGAYVAR